MRNWQRRNIRKDNQLTTGTKRKKNRLVSIQQYAVEVIFNEANIPHYFHYFELAASTRTDGHNLLTENQASLDYSYQRRCSASKCMKLDVNHMEQKKLSKLKVRVLENSHVVMAHLSLIFNF